MGTYYETEFRKLLNLKNNEIIEFLKNEIFLKEINKCTKCNDNMEMKTYNMNIDGFIYRCHNKNCETYKKRYSIRKDSFLQKANCSLVTWLEILFRFAKNERMVKTREDITISRPTLTRIHQAIRQCMENYLKKNNKIGR